MPQDDKELLPSKITFVLFALRMSIIMLIVGIFAIYKNHFWLGFILIIASILNAIIRWFLMKKRAKRGY